MGCMGMRLNDFCLCTPAEFRAIFNAWQKREEMKQRQEWERTRMACLCSLQPYSKRKLDPTDILLFDWEKGNATEADSTLTREQVKARYRRALARAGLREH